MSKQLHPLTDLPPVLWEMVSWLEEVSPFKEVQKYTKYYYNPKVPRRHVFHLYTKEYHYIINVVMDNKNLDPWTMSAQMSSRKPRAGEDWNRGNDLPDGRYSRKTWDLIKSAIIATELVKIVSPTHFKKEKQRNDKSYLDLPSNIISNKLKEKFDGERMVHSMLRTFEGTVTK